LKKPPARSVAQGRRSRGARPRKSKGAGTPWTKSVFDDAKVCPPVPTNRPRMFPPRRPSSTVVALWGRGTRGGARHTVGGFGRCRHVARNLPDRVEAPRARGARTKGPKRVAVAAGSSSPWILKGGTVTAEEKRVRIGNSEGPRSSFRARARRVGGGGDRGRGNFVEETLDARSFSWRMSKKNGRRSCPRGRRSVSKPWAAPSDAADSSPREKLDVGAAPGRGRHRMRFGG